jgi:dTDP-glucose 4,6-dehydratase
MKSSPLGQDLDDIVDRSHDDLEALRGSRLFISGGTGFVGKWLLETVLWANARMNLGLRATVLTRDPEGFEGRSRRLSSAKEISVIRGDVRELDVRDAAYDGVIHAATTASAELNERDPALAFETIVEGGRRMLEFAARSGAIPVLFTSSGAVYGTMPQSLERFAESYRGAPDPLEPKSAYHEGKRVCELQCALYARSSHIRPKIARMFAFLGPYLPLSRHFAAGNFVRDALAGSSVDVRGDGTAVRSYLYAGDMVTWLLAIFVRGKPLRAYNVGSESALDMKNLADAVASCVSPRPSVRILGEPGAGAPDRYVPDTTRARAELAVGETVPLRVALERTFRFYRSEPDVDLT